MKRLVSSCCVAALLSGCAGGIPGNVVSTQDVAAVQGFLQKAASARIAGLQAAQRDFAAATPQLTDGITCVGTLPDPTKPIDNVGLTNVGTGLLGIWAAVQREVAANPPGSGLSAEEAIAKASIYQPNSAQFQWVIKTAETGCVAYGQDIGQAVSTTSGLFTSGALSGILAGAPMGVQNSLDRDRQAYDVHVSLAWM